MKQKSALKILFFVLIVFMFLFAASFLIMPAASKNSLEGKQTLLLWNGIWFWTTGLSSLILFGIINQGRKKQLKGRSNSKNRKRGIICFFSNVWAKAADGAFVASFIGLIVFKVFLTQSYMVFLFAFLSVFTFLMHCMLNGENFKYIWEI